MNTQSLIRWIMTFCVVGVFLFDCLTPRGWAVWLLYIVPIGGTYWSAQRFASLRLAALCSILVIVGFFFSAPGVPAEMAILNRFLGVVMFWFLALVVEAKSDLRRISFGSEAAAAREQALGQKPSHHAECSLPETAPRADESLDREFAGKVDPHPGT
jgi:hypothetical protein